MLVVPVSVPMRVLRRFVLVSGHPNVVDWCLILRLAPDCLASVDPSLLAGFREQMTQVSAVETWELVRLLKE